jgi:hypothetical protein
MITGVLIGMGLMAPLTLISMIGWFGGDRDQRAEFNRRTKTRTAAERQARRRLGMR